MQRLIIFLLMGVMLTACAEWLPREGDAPVTVMPNEPATLAAQANAPTATNADLGNPVFVPTSTPFPTATSQGADTSAANTCTPRTDWPTYTVQRGDTLFSIATRAGSDLSTVAAGNCITDPDRIEVGQVIFVPQPIAIVSDVQIALIAEDGRAGTVVGCGDTAVMLDTGISPTNAVTVDVQRAFEALLAYDNSITGLTTSLIDLQDASGVTATLNGDVLRVDISDDLSLVGVCSDARMAAQMMLTAFQFEGFEQVQIFVNGINFKQAIDMSGQSSADAVFLRSDQP